ncbi:MAG: Lrp/AsnC ligand binding domain-containing protein [Thermoplasmata archaeon]|nr:Lrp/AsnC ligand binding domain-containing protein [Thermoplasmata archaeon]MCI4337717.1 Lrp/AsnC ligand binding domain-containing protein [Thermoplasmata archaeon]MCI4342018.1 Lrp/AsnC ligand binding domain-containing protein [Thermoplasmata archaeon]
MADTGARRLQMYVESRKVVTSFYRPAAPRADGAGMGGAAMTGADDRMEPGESAFFLSDDQAHALALAEEIAAKRGYSIEVKDVAKAGRLERIVTEQLRGVQTFPVLIGPRGGRLEGVEAFTEDRLCELMPAEMPVLRAFTYLKIRGGDVDAFRETVLAFPQVRELHLLTGDWDAFLVLEFEGTGGPTKRTILDFVTTKIRGLPEVVDTSTLVPEYSVTKFAF